MKALIPVLLLLPSVASAQSYTLTQFDYPGATGTIATAINNLGQVLGIYSEASNANHCFLRNSDGSLTTLSDPPGAIPGSITCNGLNDSGETVGAFRDSGGSHLYIRSGSGGFTIFDPPGASGPGPSAAGINDRGDVVGTPAAPPNGRTGYVRAADGSFTVLQDFAIGSINPTAINNQGAIAGWVLDGSSQGTQHGFLRTPNGVYTKFDLPGTTSGTHITAINNAGQFAGKFGNIGFVGQSDGTFALLNVSFLNGINDSGQIAGATFDGRSHGFIGMPGSAPTQPAIRTLLPGVMPASEFSAAVLSNANTIAPGTWIEIYGQNLSSSTRAWRDSDFKNGGAPTSLDGVTVSIAGVPAFVSYISPGQINALVPSTIPEGTASLVVANGAFTSAPATVTVVAAQPALLTVPPLSDPQSANLAALFPDFTTYALPPLPDYSNVPTRVPRAGDTIVLFGVGFGPVIPDVPVGQIATQPTNVAGAVQISFIGTGAPVPARVTYAGLVPTTVGLYQFNVIVPDVPSANGTLGVAVMINGALVRGRILSIPVGN